MCRGCSLQGGSKEEPGSQAPGGPGKTSSRRRRSTEPRPEVKPPPADVQARLETFRAQQRGRRGETGGSAPAEETQPTMEAEFDSGPEDSADSARAHDAPAADESVTQSEQDSGVNEMNETGKQRQPASGDSGGTPGSGQGPAGAQPRNPIEGEASDPRRNAHELVAQAQALLHIASQDEILVLWWPGGVPDVHPTFLELAVKAGQAHAEIASGRYDDQLADSIGHPLGRAKTNPVRRLLVRIQNYVRRQEFGKAAGWIKPAVGIASTALGSMSFIPGVGAIKEGLDLIPPGLDAVERLGQEGLSELPDKPEQTGSPE